VPLLGLLVLVLLALALPACACPILSLLPAPLLPVLLPVLLLPLLRYVGQMKTVRAECSLFAPQLSLDPSSWTATAAWPWAARLSMEHR